MWRIGQVARMAGVSARTLRHYDQLGLLAPAAVDRVTGYRWFDLRDADSSNPSFESQYGLMRDDYAPKPAFDAYRELIARLG